MFLVWIQWRARASKEQEAKLYAQEAKQKN